MAKSENPDVIVVGAGIFGLCSAYFCARAGLQVTVLDAGKVGGGASGGIVGAMAPHTPDEWNVKKKFQFEALDTAQAFWAEVDESSGKSSGYGRVGRVMPILDERQLELSLMRVDSSKSLWEGRYDWNVLTDHPMIDGPLGVIHETLSARVYPAMACASLAAALRQMNVEIVENTRVSDISGQAVSGDWGTLSADKIILAAGTGGFPFIGPNAGKGIKGQAALLNIDLAPAPQIFSDGLYVVPHENGTTAIGSTSELEFDHDTSTDSQLDDLMQRAFVVLPRLRDADVIQRWAGLRPRAKRRSPMLGTLPDQPNIIAALGGFKIGFGIAHKVGALVADVVDDKDLEVPKSFTVDWHLSD